MNFISIKKRAGGENLEKERQIDVGCNKVNWKHFDTYEFGRWHV